jgi:hypothetical protein
MACSDFPMVFGPTVVEPPTIRTGKTTLARREVERP